MRLLTVPEAAEETRLSEDSIYRAIEDRQLRAYKPRNQLRISEGDLETWITSCEVGLKRKPTKLDKFGDVINLKEGAGI